MEKTITIRKTINEKTVEDYKIDFQTFVNSIKNPNQNIKETILKARQEYVLNGKTNNYKSIKKSLPCVYLNAIFEGKNTNYENVVASSNRLFFDVDEVNNLEEIKGKLIQNKFVESVWISVSQKGLQFTVQIDLQENVFDNYIFQFIQESIFEGIKLDSNAFKITQPSFFSYDENIFHNPESYKIFIPKNYTSTLSNSTKKKINRKQNTSSNLNINYDEFKHYTKKEIEDTFVQEIKEAVNYFYSPLKFYKGYFFMKQDKIEVGERNKYMCAFIYHQFQYHIINKLTSKEDINNILKYALQYNSKAFKEMLGDDEVETIYNYYFNKYKANRININDVQLSRYIWTNKQLTATEKRQIVAKNNQILIQKRNKENQEKNQLYIIEAVKQLNEKGIKITNQSIVNQITENGHKISIITVKRNSELVKQLKNNK
ncbi:MAG: hypothetical protein EKK61_04755 [Rickettsiales bacterium]|nr:MAG: hypothetical protein EKK61_04755 [Rickettsiales bacterium]